VVLLVGRVKPDDLVACSNLAMNNPPTGVAFEGAGGAAVDAYEEPAFYVSLRCPRLEPGGSGPDASWPAPAWTSRPIFAVRADQVCAQVLGEDQVTISGEQRGGDLSLAQPIVGQASDDGHALGGADQIRPQQQKNRK